MRAGIMYTEPNVAFPVESSQSINMNEWLNEWDKLAFFSDSIVKLCPAYKRR